MTVRQLFESLNPDPWRQTVGFSDDITATNTKLFSTESDSDRAEILLEWLGARQPCLFGRMAARARLLHVCVLSEQDLLQSDQYIRDKIQNSRLEWSRSAFKGASSGFIVAAISPRLVDAIPNDLFLRLGQLLASLYLRTEIAPDVAYLEDICLQIPDRQYETWLWRGGVNYFAAAGDRRWWHDHRVPGGVALSVNSVGHLVKSGRLANDERALEVLMGFADDPRAPAKIDALPKALEFAMRTIAMADVKAPSGPATRLLPVPTTQQGPQCPWNLPPNLADKDHCEYEGWYHTDHTIPRPAAMTILPSWRMR